MICVPTRADSFHQDPGTEPDLCDVTGKVNDMNFHGDNAVSYVEHQDHLFKICRSHTQELLQSNSDLQIR